MHANSASINSFLAELNTMERVFRYDLTAPGEALAHAAQLLSGLPTPCRSQVIDVSGDGILNAGRRAGSIADALAMQNVEINGLVVRGDKPDPLLYYQEEIRRGPLSFIEIADGYKDFARALEQKLLRELLRELSPRLLQR